MINIQEPVKTIMSPDPIYVEENTTMDKVALVFDKRQIHHIPVVNKKEECTGIISKGDYLQILDKFSKFNIPSSNKINGKVLPSLLAKEVMSKEPICIDAEDPIETAIEIFLANVFRALVVKSNGKMVGIITPYDVLKVVKNKLQEV